MHDRVQEAVLRQVDEQVRPTLHWRIGNRLLANLPIDASIEAWESLFTIAAHLNRGRPEMLDEANTYRLVDINFHAGNKALDALAVNAANEFFHIAHDYLPEDCWSVAYEKSYRIYQRLAKTDLMRGNYEASEVLLNQLIDHADSDLDKAEALAEQTTSLSSFGNFIQAIATANRGLAYFEKSIPEDAAEARQRMQALMAQVEAQGDVWHAILHMPFTHERKHKIELAFYSELIPDLYMSGLVPQLYLSAAQSTLNCLHGGMDESVIYSFSIMGLNLGEQEQFELAFRYEDLAHDLCAKYPNTFGATRGMNGIVWCNMHSRSHPSEIVDYCLKGIQCGKNCGDLYNAGLSYGPLMWNLVVQGKNLRRVEEYAEECLQFSRKNHLSFSISLAEAVLAGWVAPMKPDFQPVPMDEKLARWESDNYIAACGSYFVLLGISQYLLGDYTHAADSLAAVNRYLHGLTDNVLKRMWSVFCILNRLRLPEQNTWQEIETEITPLLQKIEIWAQFGPLLRPYLALLHAEIARARGELHHARNLYLDAIAEAHAQDYGLLTGHLYECLGDVLSETRQGNPEIYYAEARRIYRISRADIKSANLQARRGYVPVDKALRIEETAHDLPEQATLPNLDVNYLMKSALALSAEIDLTQLLQKIMSVVLESSGAQHGYLLIKEQDELIVAAENHVGKKQAVHDRHYRLADARGICQAIVNYVFRTREKVVLRDASAEGDFQGAPEVQMLGMRSILCLPVVKQAELIGVLYLENRLSEGIFTSEKTGMTELLTSHAAISLENARLLDETRRAYRQLQENQEHMQQMEKLSALGTLVGGVAHEINNPLMGVMNYVENVAEKTTDQKSREVLDLAMTQILRIKSIVRNMLIFVRTNTVATGTSDICTVVSQTLLLLEGKLEKSGIQIRLSLPETLPEIIFNADSLQQVLVNLILNARDAMAGSVQSPRIEISARMAETEVILNVCDNGPGIPDEIKSRIFDPFFTTKPPGKGTGLGLSVSRRLVEDAGGTIKAQNIKGQGCCMQLQFKAIINTQ